MKITQYDDLYTQKLGAGETTLVSGSSGGSNSAFGGDVVGSAGSLSVVGLRQTVSLSSNLAPSAAVGNVLTLISVGGTPVAQFAVPSNSSVVSFGSNATRVSASSFVGASTNSAREDHRHDGIGTVTASSSNTLDRGTLNLRAGSNVAFALTDSDGSGGFDTLTVSSTASGGGAAGASGALILLEQHTASASAQLDFTSISTTYDDYLFEIVSLLSATNTVQLYLRCSTDGGSTFDSSAIYSYSHVYSYPGATAQEGSSGATFFGVGGASTDNSHGGTIGQVHLYNPLTTGGYKFISHSHIRWVASGINVPVHEVGGGQYASTTAVNAIRFLFSSGNITSGTIRMYGIAK